MICCIGYEKGLCYGDSGGPMKYKGKVVGIASLTLGECGTIGVYTSVDVYLQWIVITVQYFDPETAVPLMSLINY